MTRKLFEKITLTVFFCAIGTNLFNYADARDLLVGSPGTNQILRYDGQTGDFTGVFIDHPQVMTASGILFGPDGNLYVGSLGNQSILRFNPQTGEFIDVFVTSGSGGLLQPLWMVFGPDGNLYVSSAFSHQVLRYNGQTGAFIDVFAEGNGLDQPSGLAFGPDGNLYVASSRSDQVLRYNSQSGAFIDEFIDDSLIFFPTVLLFGPDGHLYLRHTDPNSGGFEDSDSRILRFNAQTGAFIDEFIPYGFNLNGDDIFGPDNNLYAAVFYSNKVMRFDGTTGAFIDDFVTAGSGGLNFVGFLAFFPPDPTPPLATMTEPADGSTNAPTGTNIEIHVEDTVSGVDLSTVVFTLNGTFAYDGSNPGAFPDTTVTGDPSDYQLTYDPPTDFINEIVVGVTVSASDQEGNPKTANFSFLTEAAVGDPWDSDDDDGDGIPNSEEALLGTSPGMRTLFVKAREQVSIFVTGDWTDEYMALFPPPAGPANGRAYIDAFNAAGIEVVVIGADDHPYAPMQDPDYDPAGDPNDFDPDTPGSQKPHVNIMEVWKINSYKGGSSYQGHTHFIVNFLEPGNIEAPQWRWDTKGSTPVPTGAPDPKVYLSPGLYMTPLDLYIAEGAYVSIGVGQLAFTLNCKNGPCTQRSPMNFNDSEAGPPYNNNPDATVELNLNTFHTDGSIQTVGDRGTPYSREEVLRRTLIHEMGHGLHLGHCLNPFCIMYYFVWNWEIFNSGTQPYYGFGTAGSAGEPCIHADQFLTNGIIHNTRPE